MKNKKIILILLSACVMMCLFAGCEDSNVGVTRESDQPTSSPEQSNVEQTSSPEHPKGEQTPSPEKPKEDISVGDLYEVGGYTWQVLDVKDDKALLITRDIIDARAFDGRGRGNSWEACSLRAWLNNEFYSGFSAQEQNRISETNVVNNSNPWFGTNGGPDTVDKVFLLSIEEVVMYFGDSGALTNWNGEDDSIRDEYGENRKATLNMTEDQQMDAAKRSAESPLSVTADGRKLTIDEQLAHFQSRNGGVYWWWLRSPGGGSNLASYVHGGAAGVCVGGDLAGYETYGVRPAIWIIL